MNDVYILGVETTCDETALAIVKNGKEVIASVVNSQIPTHTKFGGVVPELASREHTENITILLEELQAKSSVKLNQISAVAVSSSPGLIGSLLVGVEFAKVLSYFLDVPLIKVNHLIAHIYASKIEHDLKYPLLALVISGGHTELAIMNGDYDFTLIGKTLDDAIGETFDKIARVLNLPYPGGPEIEKKALEGKLKYNFPIPNLENYDFSYSGLKSNVINTVHNIKQKNKNLDVENIAYSFQHTSVKQIINVVKKAINNFDIKNVVIAGGVSANKYLRNQFKEMINKYNGELYVPSLKYCTDNASMVAVAAYPLFIEEEFTTLALSPKSKDKLF